MLLGQYGEMRMSRLAELLAVDMSVTSRHVAHVAERGWIDRSPDPADKRSRILSLTEQGVKQIELLSERSTELLAYRLSDWSDDEVGQLIAMMKPAPRQLRRLPIHTATRAGTSGCHRRDHPYTRLSKGTPWQQPHRQVCGATTPSMEAQPPAAALR